jgi:hypothetical protein
MTFGIATTIRRALRPRGTTADAAVHFHVGGDGQAFVCDLARCDSPSLSLREVNAG